MKLHRCLALVLLSFFSFGALCQSYSIQGEEGYTKPEYFLLAEINPDPAGVYNHFLSAFRRAGFDVMNPDWVQHQINAEWSEINVARQISMQDQEIDENELRDLLKNQGLLSGWKAAIQSLVESGHVVESEKIVEGRFRDKKIAVYSWSEGKEIPEETWSAPNKLHVFSCNYTYRESMSCGTTLSDLHGTILNVSGDLKEQLVDFDYRQPRLSSECPKGIVNEIVRRITRNMREEVVTKRSAVESDISFSIKGDGEEIGQVQTILTVAKPGEDCFGLKGSHFEDEIALGLLESYDVIDRSVTDHIIQEHKLNMDGLFRDSDFIEAGQFAGAEALVTIQAACLSEMNVLKVKMISINSSLLLWSAIIKNPDRSVLVEEVLNAIHN